MSENLAEKVRKCLETGTGVIWVASSGVGGEPHLALTRALDMPDDDTVQLTDWCCLKTIENLRDSPRLTIGIYNKDQDEGWQLVGTADDVAIASPPEAGDPSDVQYTVTVKVRDALHLVAGRHSDSAM